MEKAMAPHSSTPAWRISGTEEPGGLQSTGKQRVRHDWATSLSHIGEGNGSPLQCSCLENPRDRGAWWAVVYGVAQSRTRLKQLSSSSSSRSETGFPGGSVDKESTCKARDPGVIPRLGRSLGEFHGQRSKLQSMGSQRVGHDWATNTHVWDGAEGETPVWAMSVVDQLGSPLPRYHISAHNFGTMRSSRIQNYIVLNYYKRLSIQEEK